MIPALDPRRAENIGASESSSLFSTGWPEPEHAPFQTRLQLWLRKSGLGKDDDDEAEALDRRFWGSYLEAGIADGFSALLRRRFLPGEFIRHEDVEGMSASTDRYVIGAGVDSFGASMSKGPALPEEMIPVELKNVDRGEYYRWPEAGAPDPSNERQVLELDVKSSVWRHPRRVPPLRYLLQTQHQLSCVGKDTSVALLGALVGGNFPRVFRIPRHQDAIDRIEAAVPEFWQSVRDGRRPPPDWSTDAETMIALRQYASSGLHVTIAYDQEFARILERYKEATSQRGELDKEAKVLKAQIFEYIGEAERLEMPGWKVTAKMVEAVFVASERSAYRGLNVTPQGAQTKRNRR